MPRHIPIHLRFWENVERSDGCWVWKLCKSRFGYGLVRIGGSHGDGRRRMSAAHRVAWMLTAGPIPPKLCVLHRCDNPPCVRPDHLFLGTQRDNTQDMIRKGRLVLARRNPLRGEQCPWTKLCRSQVTWIRRLSSQLSQDDIAWLAKIHQTHVSGILSGRAWRHA
jgi:hypothetical protein